MNDTPQLLLAHHLKALRLPTFLREYDKIARQCSTEGIDHSRYLLRLAELKTAENGGGARLSIVRAARFELRVDVSKALCEAAVLVKNRVLHLHRAVGGVRHEAGPAGRARSHV